MSDPYIRTYVRFFGDTVLGPFGGSPNIYGATLTGGVLSLEPAGIGFPGGLSTVAQSISGLKTFVDRITLNSLAQESAVDGAILQWSTANNQWQAGSSSAGALIMGPFQSTGNPAGGFISAGSLFLTPADNARPGGVSTSAQTFGGKKTFYAGLDAGGQQITGVADPLTSTDAATKSYVDAVASGLQPKASVRVATAAALPANARAGNVLTASSNGVLVVDTVTVVANNRILVKNEAASENNGIYTVTSAGSVGSAWVLTRSTDADTSAKVVSGLFTFADEGSVNADTGWVLTTNDPIVLNITGLVFARFSAFAQVSLGPVGSTPNANAGIITGSVLNLQPADGSNPGVVSTLAQAFGGLKTLSGVNLASANPGLSAAGNTTLRSYSNMLSASVNGGAYHVIATTKPGCRNVLSYGAVGDGTTDNSPAFEAAMADVTAIGGAEIYVPSGTYRLSRSWHVTAPVRIVGDTPGENQFMRGSSLVFDAGVNGIVIDPWNYPISGASFAAIEWLGVRAAARTTTKHGIVMWTRAKINHCIVTGFMGDGIHIVADDSFDGTTAWAPSTVYHRDDWVTNDTGKHYLCLADGTSGSSGGPTGYGVGIVDGTTSWTFYGNLNANGWSVIDCRIDTVGRHGLYVFGTNANAGNSFGLDVAVTGGFGLLDNSFLGNTHVGAQAATCTSGGYGTGTNGNQNGRNLFLNCYSESGMPGSDIRSPSMVLGGLHAAGFATTATASILITENPGTYGYGASHNQTPTRFTIPGDAYSANGPDVAWSAFVGGNPNIGSFITLSTEPTYAAFLYFKRSNSLLPTSFCLNFAANDFYNGWGWSGYPAKTPSGRLTAPASLLVGQHYPLTFLNNLGDDLRIQALRTVPDASSGAFGGGIYQDWYVGDRVLNSAPTPGSVSEWVCVTAGTAGTYTESSGGARTATATGTTTVTLSSATTGIGLNPGAWLTINGVTAKVISITGTTMVMSAIIPSGSSLPIVYSAPVFSPTGYVGGGAGTGTVTSVSVTTANGVSGTVTNPTSTAAISLTLGAITPTSVAATTFLRAGSNVQWNGATSGGLYDADATHTRLDANSARSISITSPLGATGTDIATIAGSTVATASLAAGAQLLSIQSGIGGTATNHARFVYNLSSSYNETTLAGLQAIADGGNIKRISIDPTNTTGAISLVSRLATGDGAIACIATHDRAQTDLGRLFSGQLFGGTETFAVRNTGRIDQQGTDSSATPGAATINKPSGISAVASGATTVVITNSLATASSKILLTWYGDSGAARTWVTRAAGSFTVNLSSAAAAATSFGWEVGGLL
jgi:Pectate lyase superfamily protein